jgi:hypothetical protein
LTQNKKSVNQNSSTNASSLQKKSDMDKRQHQAAEAIKYTTPLTNTKAPAMMTIRLRLLTLTSIDNRNINTHMAHGLKPSNNPVATVKIGKPYC